MDEINGSVNVSEILGTLTDKELLLIRAMALDICRGRRNHDRTIRINTMKERLNPVQATAVTAFLTEVQKRRDELLKELTDVVDDVIFEGVNFRQKIVLTKGELK